MLMNPRRRGLARITSVKRPFAAELDPLGRSGTRCAHYTMWGWPVLRDVSRVFSGPQLEIRACICLSVSTIQIPFSELSPQP
jgi:hypothetical protein